MSKEIVLREGSYAQKLFNSVKDGKVQKYTVVKAKLIRMGVSKPYALCIYLRAMLVRTGAGKCLVFSKRTNTIQLVDTSKVPAKKTKVVAKTAKKKVVAKKKTVKPVAKKVLAKKSKSAATKAKNSVLVALGPDEELIEE